jgi:hypothetical protein
MMMTMMTTTCFNSPHSQFCGSLYNIYERSEQQAVSVIKKNVELKRRREKKNKNIFFVCFKDGLTSYSRLVLNERGAFDDDIVSVHGPLLKP